MFKLTLQISAKRFHLYLCNVLVNNRAHTAQVIELQDLRQQPTLQAKTLLRFILEKAVSLNAAGQPHSALSLNTILCSPARGWHLAPFAPRSEDDAPSTAGANEAAVRTMCFVCLPPARRKEFQPHRLAEIKSEQLLKYIEHIPSLKIMASALMTNASVHLDHALSFYFWHDFEVQAQVRRVLCTLSYQISAETAIW